MCGKTVGMIIEEAKQPGLDALAKIEELEERVEQLEAEQRAPLDTRATGEEWGYPYADTANSFYHEDA